MTDPLLDRARAGDRLAMEELLARHVPAIYRFGKRMCGSARVGGAGRPAS
jgi:DNA-directed RNA polymerase specialized sigma24 family protein